MPLILSGSLGVSGIDGSKTTPSLQGLDVDTGIFFPSLGVVAVSTNGDEALRVNSVGDVGIGTSIPTNYAGYRTLSVGGTGANGAIDVNFSNGLYGMDIYAYKDPSSAADDWTEIAAANSANEPTWLIGYRGENTGYGAYFQTVKSQPITFFTNNLEKMRITSTGNVGIGSTSPTVKLDVNGTVNASEFLVNGEPLSSGGISTGKAIAMAIVFG